MSELTPCPECQRHVRQVETTCPFCGQALALSYLPARPLPRSRLSRAATFAFGATLVGASALVSCGGESESKKGGAAGTASGGAGSGGTASGGTASGGAGSGGRNDGEIRGGGDGIAPPYGTPPDPGGGNGAGGTFGGIGCVDVLAGAPAAGSGDTGGGIGIPK